jgi:sigma-B regulation protein RsbU (phosphoserine phosphatase)
MRVLNRVTVACAFLAWILGFVSLLLNCGRAVEPEARRKARLLGGSFAVGLVPWMALIATSFYLQRDLFDLPFWLWVPCALLMMFVPVLFGYAVVKHRVLGFSVLVRRSARYVFVQRGFVLLALALSVAVTAVFVAAISRVLPRLTDAAVPAGISAGTIFGLALFLTGGALSTRVTRRIDRAFFRSAYDARQILEDLARQTALAQDRDELAALLDGQFRQALHPRRLDIYLRDQSGTLRLFVRGAPDSPHELEVPPALTARFAEGGRPCGPPDGATPCPALAAMRAECVVPMLSRRRALVGLIVLGGRLSDEPYSSEDETLLASIASQAGGALENLLLAEQMAERIEADRRSAQEVRIAAEVQRRLLPVKTVEMATVEYIGRCVQARSVGGDYYDFIDLGRGQMGLVLGDVSGKGLYAALLMANLQANVRSLSARLASEDLATLLATLNHTFDEATAGNHFATLFFGHYDDVRRRLRYANCGQQPPLLLRAGGGIERLGVTGGAIGLLDEWTCTVEEVVLQPGDLLALCSDGVTEAMSPEGEEFGEARLLDALLLHRDRPLIEVIERIVGAVRAFGGAEQSDDLTLVLVRARPVKVEPPG